MTDTSDGPVAGLTLRKVKRGCDNLLRMVLLVYLIVATSAQARAEYAPPPYQQLRYDEDYSYLRDPARRVDLWDAVKYVPLGGDGELYLTLGGDIRERYDYFDNTAWGKGPEDNNGYLLQRYMFHADLQLGPHVRLFGQWKSGLEDGRNGGPRPPDRDRADLHQAFLDIAFGLGGDGLLLIRAGRQEMAFGSSRLVSVREGPNVRQSFDGARVTARTGGWSVDGFVTRPVKTKENIFDDGTDFTRSFWGAYVSGPLAALPDGHADIYYFGLDKADAKFDQGVSHEHRHSVGARLWGAKSPFDYNFEFVYQWGSFGRGVIQAWTAASDTGYTFSSVTFSPRIGLKADITSGDKNPDNPDLQTFNPLFPKGAYFNETELIGPANLMDLHPSVDLHVIKPVTFTLDWDFFWRESTSDGIYGNAVNLVRSGRESGSSYIGSALSSRGEWRVDRHVTLVGVYTRFFAGPFLRETGPGKDVDFLAAWAAYRF